MKTISSGLLCALFILASAGLLSANQEVEVERNLAVADSFFEKSDYPAAIEAYFKAAALSTKPENLSRAYFGLSLCHFYQRDMAESVRWMRKVALVDPDKRISADAYPKPFVDLFTQVLAEARAKGTPVVSPGRVEGPPTTAPQPKAVEVAPEKTEPPPSAEAPPQAGKTPPAAAPVLPPAAVVSSAGDFWSRLAGRFEISVHFSDWTVSPVTSLFESSLKDEFGEAIQTAINRELNRRYPFLIKGPFSSDLALDSEGSNFGFEIRYYARGRAGMFSLGLGFEKTNIAFSASGTARQEYAPAGGAEAAASAKIETKPFATHLSFRWEIGSPAARVKPFVTFGLGLAPLDGTFEYSYLGTYSYAGYQESIQDAAKKDFKALSEDIDFDIPDLIVFLQMDIGLKVEIFRGLFLTGQAGLWNGLHLRGGIGYRF